MKGLILFVVATILMAMVSCTPNFDQPSEIYPGQKLAFEATYADDPSTKTVVQEDGKSIWWSAHEDISVFCGNSESSKFTSRNDEPVAKAVFEGTIETFTGETETGEVNYFWAVYPYNKRTTCDGSSITTNLSPVQIAKDETFSDNQWLTIAKSQGLSLSFFAVCSGFRFSVTKEGITSVSFKGNDNEILAGEAKITMSASNRPVVVSQTTSYQEITLLAPSGETLQVGTLYYISFFPTNFTKGFTISFNTQTETGTRVYDAPIDFKRAEVNRGRNFDSSVAYVKKETIPPIEAVDLGLSVLWASTNLGATTPEGYGNYYSWGETLPKQEYSKSTYMWWDDANQVLIDVNECCEKESGVTKLKKEYDAAYVNLRGHWRMPSMEEIKELTSNCTWTLAARNGISGYEITSKIVNYTDKSIFIPIAGHYRNNSQIRDTEGFYCSSEAGSRSNQDWWVKILDFTSTYKYTTTRDGYDGLTIRPVWEK